MATRKVAQSSARSTKSRNAFLDVDVFVARSLHDDDLVGYAAKHKLAKQRTADTSTVEHTRRENSGVVHNPKKVIDFDLAADAAARVC